MSVRGWQEVVVGVVLIIAIAGIELAALLKYGLDDALKMWAAIGTLVGAVVTYFFQRERLQEAAKKAESLDREAEALDRQVKNTHEALTAVTEEIEPDRLAQLQKENEVLRAAMGSPPIRRGPG
jgi:hypothetical protein